VSLHASSGADPDAGRAGADAAWADPSAAPEAFARGLLRAVVLAAPAPAALLCAVRDGNTDASPVLTAGAVDDLARAVASDPAPAAQTSLRPLESDESAWLASVPCRVSETATLVAVARVLGDREQARQALMRMELVATLSESWRAGREERTRREAAEAPARALAVLVAVNEHDAFFAACLAACNEIAERWGAERASIGFVKSGVVRLAAVSHAERLTSAGELTRSLETVMEEATDQDLEVICPPEPDDVVITRAAREHLARRAVGSCATLPLRVRGEPVGALCVEWAERATPSLRAVEPLRLSAELLAPRLLDIRARDRWIGARAWAATMDAGASLVGPRHTGVKLAAVLVAAFLLFTIFAKGADRVSADMTIEPVARAVVPAPFEGFIAQTHARAGDRVEAGDPLATLDTSELLLERAELRSEQRSSLAEEAMARREGETARAQAARAQADRAAARLALIERRLELAVVRAPAAGVVTEGDLERLVGAPVAAGDQLFAVAPVDRLRAEVLVPEGRIADVAEGSTGALAAAGYPGRRVGFTVERLDPVARAVEGGNVFAARVRLDESPSWMRPGMEGVAKIDAGRRPYAVIWTRDLVNWVRMKLWI